MKNPHINHAAMRQNVSLFGQRMFNTPMLLHPGKAEILQSMLSTTIFDAGGDDDSDAKPYAVIQGVALIQISGVLLQKLGSCYSYWGMTGYDGIRANFIDAFHDDSIRAIVLDIDSGGGECAGCFDLADLIYSARGKKPIWAICNETAYSSAYALASAADKVCVPRTGGTGSIGVIAMLVDVSKAMDEAGIAVNIIQFGARKADGQPFIPLSTPAREKFQADVDAIGDMFVQMVARNRNLSPAAVQAQQAGTFMGQNGVGAGLADMVAAPDAAFYALLSTLQT